MFNEKEIAFLELKLAPFLWLFLIAVCLFLFFRIVKRILIPFLKVEKVRIHTSKIITLVEKIFWVLFFIIVFFTIIITNPLPGILVVIVGCAFLWHFISNFLAGIFILLSNNYNIGQRIIFNKIEGIIVGLHNGEVEIELENAEFVNIPNSNFIKGLVIRTSPSEKIISHVVKLHISKPCDTTIVEEDIYLELLQSPWLLPSESPHVEVLEETENQVVFKVVLIGIDKRHLEHVSSLLIEHLNSTVGKTW